MDAVNPGEQERQPSLGNERAECPGGRCPHPALVDHAGVDPLVDT
jgi:hypothetical protein